VSKRLINFKANRPKLPVLVAYGIIVRHRSRTFDDDHYYYCYYYCHTYFRNEGVLAIRSYGNWHAQCITEDYTNVDYHSLCKGLGFKHAVGIRKVDSAKVDFENFTVVQLNNITDVAVRSATKHILQHTDRTCTTVYVVCSSS